MDAPQQRRATDKAMQDEIRKLIADADDPKDRAFLIILSAINDSLIANTQTISSVSEKLDTHLTKFEEHTRIEEAMVNQGRGMWKLAAGFLGVLQAVGLALWMSVSSSIAELSDFAHKDIAQHAVIDNRLNSLENRVSKHEEGRLK